MTTTLLVALLLSAVVYTEANPDRKCFRKQICVIGGGVTFFCQTNIPNFMGFPVRRLPLDRLI